MSMVLLSVPNSRGCPGELRIVNKQFEDLKNLTLNVLKEKLISCLVGSCLPKTGESFQNSTVQTAMISKAMITF